jgi:hypothetical protein
MQIRKSSRVHRGSPRQVGVVTLHLGGWGWRGVGWGGGLTE